MGAHPGGEPGATSVPGAGRSAEPDDWSLEVPAYLGTPFADGADSSRLWNARAAWGFVFVFSLGGMAASQIEAATGLAVFWGLLAVAAFAAMILLTARASSEARSEPIEEVLARAREHSLDRFLGPAG